MPKTFNGQKVTKSQLAETFGVAFTTVTHWVRRGCPFEQRGHKGHSWEFNTANVARWREEQAALAAAGDTTKMDFDEAKRRKTAAEAALSELELSKARGDVVEIDDVEGVWTEIVTAFRAKTLAIAPKAAPALVHETDPRVIERLLEAEIIEALDELSKYELSDPESDAVFE